MSDYLIGIILSFCGPIMHAWANIIDNYFTNKIFKRLEVLIAISQFFGLLLLLLPLDVLGLLQHISATKVVFLLINIVIIISMRWNKSLK